MLPHIAATATPLVQVYTVSGGKNIPAWLSDKKKKALRKDEEYRRRIELIQVQWWGQQVPSGRALQLFGLGGQRGKGSAGPGKPVWAPITSLRMEAGKN